MASRASITKVRFLPKVNVPGAVKVIAESGPTFTVIVRVISWPPVEVKVIVKVVSPWLAGVKVLTGVITKEQVLAVRVTEVSFVLSTLAASEQVMVWPLPDTSAT